MFERDNSVFAGVVFTLDTHNQILRTGYHTAVAAMLENTMSTTQRPTIRRTAYDVGLNYITMLWK